MTKTRPINTPPASLGSTSGIVYFEVLVVVDDDDDDELGEKVSTLL